MHLSRITPLFPLAALLIAGCNDVSGPETASEQPVGLAANVRISDPEIPMYADLGYSYIPEDDGWVAVVFKRPPACIPEEFNLLVGFDVPGAFGCGPMTVTGHAIFSAESDYLSGVPPRQVQLTGRAVPVWLAPAVELHAAAADGELTIVELAALPGLLRGTASTYHQATKNSAAATGRSGARAGSSSSTARGELEDGRSFSLQVAEKFEPGIGRTFMQVRIAVGR